jgi:glycosyltransferase involved in cell wall biosynthesis
MSGVAIVTYNRGSQLGDQIEAVLRTVPADTRVVVCDDGSTDDTPLIAARHQVLYLRGLNLGVGANKNRALYALRDAHFFAIIEDDLFPAEPGWFETYEEAAIVSGIHHFCRVQDKEVPENVPPFTVSMAKRGFTPIYGSSPRGDLTFGTGEVIRRVGAFNPAFKGAGFAHGEWSARVDRAGLIPHPLKWVDIKEARDKFVQKGDTEGGRWTMEKRDLKEQLKANKQVLKSLNKRPYLYHPLTLS